MHLSSVVVQALKLQNSILAKYLIRNVLILTAAVFMVIGLVIFGNQLVLVIKESLEEGVPIAELMPLVSFKMIRDVPLILSLSLFLAIILAISKSYKDSEAIVMNSLGIGDKHLMVFIQPVVIVIFIFILFLTTVAVPWSKQQRSMIMDRSENASEFSFIKEGEFQEFKGGDIVFYAEKVKSTEGESTQDMEKVFIYALSGGQRQPIITLADQAHKYTDAKTKSVYLRLKEGVRYHGFPAEVNKKILNFDQYDLQIIDGENNRGTTSVTKIESKPTLDLIFSSDVKEIAEWQWRISQPISVLILSIFGILLGKTSPRGGKNLGVLTGVLVFIVYNNALLVAKSSLERGEISAFVGMWWVHLTVLLIIFVFYAYRHGKFSQLIGKAF
ncbi:LPS export ABC transporter permease LptF [Candidatus Thioglobus sp.]|jgi:lipopolysaccharide export system permease protein|uniref:LPS export ABC transporter permease LptF n=1 Tax=Candidatus Thioglobus sp. TaxID=2026721 RepID=UPI001DD17364|nr:LPS export ABC transporter permease LptF [Candidatus Thioglobus sp.]MBT3277509.1 LPS export ABC transporter permease LptF [Candidatus Thioglobus sp.]MBT3446416.1 LPS export ABC transporter permease LptF [Candidatus Thioglobus sp.]MBT3744882.1 LPS export ABC transporter permease LptF [Candidatus Thioglobus sp.]MBT4000507.1 LPS export ABC transporter permease LptF [Candidatus Thioglobus sp.]MBT4181277.1 LPS export ABC transporter permease LptF [Candidatus Thioglobus sp.]